MESVLEDEFKVKGKPYSDFRIVMEHSIHKIPKTFWHTYIPTAMAIKMNHGNFKRLDIHLMFELTTAYLCGQH